ESKKIKNWISVQWITIIKKKYFVLVRPVILYEITNGINLVKRFPQDLFRERDNLELKALNYILYGNGKSIQLIQRKGGLSVPGSPVAGSSGTTRIL
ncbi:hypothetical protein HN873_015797, partial [Arachis hypogaea]